MPVPVGLRGIIGADHYAQEGNPLGARPLDALRGAARSFRLAPVPMGDQDLGFVHDVVVGGRVRLAPGRRLRGRNLGLGTCQQEVKLGAGLRGGEVATELRFGQGKHDDQLRPRLTQT